MACEYCLKSVGHAPGCPNYVMPKSNLTCCSCGESILPEEEYVENENGYLRHFECFDGLKDVLRFLGYEIKKIDSEIQGSDYWWL